MQWVFYSKSYFYLDYQNTVTESVDNNIPLIGSLFFGSGGIIDTQRR